MKFLNNEQLKNRFIGIIVIFLIALIFTPAIIKKSKQLEQHMTIALKMPPKPALPQVKVPAERILFKELKVAHVDLNLNAPINKERESNRNLDKSLSTTTLPKIANHEIGIKLSRDQVQQLEPPSSPGNLKHPGPAKLSLATKPKPLPTKTAPEQKPLLAKKITRSTTVGNFAVQVASFSQKENADILIKKLTAQGFKAYYSRLEKQNQFFYQVMVGSVPQRAQALALQRKLALATQMRGFVVRTKAG